MIFLVYSLILIALIAADQLLKYWTMTNLAIGESAPFIPHILQLTQLHNSGAAWSSFSGKTILLLIVTAILMILVIILLAKKIVRHPIGVTACLLILGGGIGNFIDRILHGYVVDMFETTFISFPVFNLADCFIVVGSILGAIYYLWIYEKTDMKGKAE